jgi:subtilase family serine protease
MYPSSRLQPGWQIFIATFIGLLIVAIIGSPASAHTLSTQDNTNSRTIIHGHLVEALQGKTPIGPLASDRVLSLSISLNLQNAQGLDALLSAQNDPNSPLYHQYLSSSKFAELFGPSQTTINAVINYLQSQGLTVGTIAPNHLTIDVTGTVAAVEQAFQAQLAEYTLGSRTVYAPTNEPSVPVELGSLIQGINGLNDVADPHRMGTMSSTSNSAGNGPQGGYTPYEFRTAYDMNNFIGLGYSGVGQTVGVFELSGYKTDDINQYRWHYGLGTANIKNIYVDGIDSSYGQDGAKEVTLDIDAISAVAPNAAIEVYIGPADPHMIGINTPGSQYFIDIWQKIINDNTAKVISTSWDDCEPHFSTSELTTLDNIFKQGAAQGQTIFAASGDAGPYECQYTDPQVAVAVPASDPYVVGVGGTTLNLNSNSTYKGETVWSCPTCKYDERPQGLASGGGYSKVFPRPSYQVGNGVQMAQGAMRQVPDVSADADGATPYSIYCTPSPDPNVNNGCPSGGWSRVGGTSGAAPLWAGIAADIDQYVSSFGGPMFVLNNPLLYTLFNQPNAPFHDITQGNNMYYNATSGYDVATGIGTPDVWNLATSAAAQAYSKFTSQERANSDISLITFNNTLYIAWAGSGNGQINLMHSTDSGKTFDSSTKYTSQERSEGNISLAAYNNTLYVAWGGMGNGQINLMSSTDGGQTFDSSTKYTSQERSSKDVSLAVYNNALYIAWPGMGNNRLNLMSSTDGGKSFDSSTKYTANDYTSRALVLATSNNTLYIAWPGSGNNQLNLMHSTDGGKTFDSSTKYVSNDTTNGGLALGDYNGVLYIAWPGQGNGWLNYMHSTDGNQTYNDGTKLVLGETSPSPITLAFTGTTLHSSWAGSGNYQINLLSWNLAH